MSYLFLDTETRSPLQLPKVGTWAYAEEAVVLLLAYARGEEAVKLWDCTVDPNMPEDLKQALNDPTVTIVAHNTAFDRVIVNKCLGFDIPPTRWLCTSVMCRANGLPASLKSACEALQMPSNLSKMEEGKALISRFSKGDINVPAFDPNKHNHVKAWRLFREYCIRDVEATRELFKLLKPLSPNEHQLWLLDQDINDRGYAVDAPLVNILANLVEEARNELDDSLKVLTAGAVCTSRQNQKLLLWIFLETWLELPDLKEDTVLKVLSTTRLPENVRTVLQNRLLASRSSVLKLKTLSSAVSNDNRLRGTLQFMGASRTGRWAGRVFQPQNLPRPSTPHEEIEEAIDSGSYPKDNLLRFASDSIRSCIVAPKGKKLVVADLSGIEARVLAWCAGEQWKVDVFKSGEDIYITTYARTFDIPISQVTKDQRAIGKVMELALGYQGGAGVFLKMASNLGLNLDDFAKAVRDTASSEDWKDAENFCLWMQDAHPEFAIDDLYIGTACELVKKAWRTKHPSVQALWSDCDDAFEYTLHNGNRISARRNAPNAPMLQMRKEQGNIYLTLPSGRDLVYRDVGVGKTYLSTETRGTGSRRDTTYGGKLTENIVQAISRDVLCEGMKNATEAGYPIVLTVHDEIVCEVPDSEEFSSDTLCALMTKNPSWATGLPLNAEGFEAKRYRK